MSGLQGASGALTDALVPVEAISEALARLHAVLDALGVAAVAVSGGVDSMVLAYYAHERLLSNTEVYHAVSPAVPQDATARVRAYAARFGWQLRVIDAGEFADDAYVSNPVNRCFFCKSNLYKSVAALTGKLMLSGANTDDLGDYRPGLDAAQAYGVRHPLVEAGINKRMVRALARHAGLDDLAELPSSPCLSSRITTGLPVTIERVGLVYAVESLLKERLPHAHTVRCRVKPNGVEVQLGNATLSALPLTAKQALTQDIQALCQQYATPDTVTFAPYVQGSAFIHEN